MDPVCLARLALLGNPLRLAVLRLLVRHLPQPVSAGDLARALAVPPSTLSAHLAALTEAGLLAQRTRGPLRLFHAVPGALAHVIDWLGADLALGRAGGVAELGPSGRPRLVMLCGDGALLAPMAVALARRCLRGKVQVLAAGVSPARQVDPVLLAMLAAQGLLPAEAVPRGVPEEGAEVMIALDAQAAAALPGCSALPVPVCAHWPLPAIPEGRVIPRAIALHVVMRALAPRLAALARLPLATLPREPVQAALDSLSSGLPEAARAAGSAPARRQRSSSPVPRASAAS